MLIDKDFMYQKKRNEIKDIMKWCWLNFYQVFAIINQIIEDMHTLT